MNYREKFELEVLEDETKMNLTFMLLMGIFIGLFISRLAAGTNQL